MVKIKKNKQSDNCWINKLDNCLKLHLYSFPSPVWISSMYESTNSLGGGPIEAILGAGPVEAILGGVL